MNKDQKILDELIGKKIPVEDFEKEIAKVMKKRSTAKVICNNIPDTIRALDGTWHKVNFRCIPDSPLYQNMFCFVLKHEDGMVVIKKGYLEKL